MLKSIHWLMLMPAMLSVPACDRYRSSFQSSPRDRSANSANRSAVDPNRFVRDEHQQAAGAMGGIVISFGRDQHHAEAVIQADGKLAVFTLGADETLIHEVPQQVLTAYLKPADSDQSDLMVLQPYPLPSDSPGMTSRFAGDLPQPSRAESFYLTIPGLTIDDQRYTLRFEIARNLESQMPEAVTDDEAMSLYLTPGGRYTTADIEANGRLTAAQKFASFRAAHDANPAVGDLICPITRTKAHRQCSWIIGGETYYFCCPPCIDEFLERAKTKPAEVLSADAYVQSE